MESTFLTDLKVESIVTDWISENFLVHYCDSYKVTRENKNQHSGVDFKITSEEIFNSDKSYNIDLKCALKYIKPFQVEESIRPSKMPTFAFELSYYNKQNQECDGWLFGEKYFSTDYYMISWIWADVPFTINEKGFLNTDSSNLDYDSVREIELMIISKKEMQNYARKLGLNKSTSRFKSSVLRKSGNNELFLHDRMRFPKLHYSKTLQEKPVNLVVHENDLKKLAIFQVTVSK